MLWTNESTRDSSFVFAHLKLQVLSLVQTMIGFGNREVAWSARTPLITGYVLDVTSTTNACLFLFDILWLCGHCVHVRKHYLVVWILRTCEHCVHVNIAYMWTLLVRFPNLYFWWLIIQLGNLTKPLRTCALLCTCGKEWTLWTNWQVGHYEHTDLCSFSIRIALVGGFVM